MKIETKNGWTCISHEDTLRVLQLDSIASVKPYKNLKDFYFRVTLKTGETTSFGPFEEKVTLGYVRSFFNKVGE